MSDNLAHEIDNLPTRSLRDKILRHTRKVALEHPSGETVYAREMTARDYRKWQELSGAKFRADGAPEIDLEATAVDETMSALVVRTMVDEHDNRLFADDEMDLVADLGLGFIIKFSKAVLDISGLSDRGTEVAEGNSGSAPSDGSS